MKHLKKSFLSLLAISLFFNVNAQKKQAALEFNFGDKVKSNSGIAINKAVEYSDALGYGFDFQTDKNLISDKKSISANSPFYFSVKLPEGNYSVEVVLGGDAKAVTTVNAESRRLMLREVKTSVNETKIERFIVNVRTGEFDGNKKLGLKPTEISGLNWDNKLTLEFLGTASIQSIKITPVSKIKTLFIAGDSTVTDQGSEPRL